MHKSDRFYTFLLTRTTKDKIFIRRLQIPKNLAHTSAAGLLLSFGMVLFGFLGVIETDAFNDLTGTFASTEPLPAATRSVKPIDNELIHFNYERPKTDDELAANSGGPTEDDFTLTANASEKERSAIERKLDTIERTSNPSYLPTIWAHLGKINNEFGYRRNPFGGRSYEFHAGMDIDGDKGDLLVAPANGTVRRAGWQGGYGYLIELDHGNGLTTRYGHLSKLEVKKGDTVQRGQLIGLIGSTGRSTGPHLHYELRLDNKPVNPRRFLPPEPSEIKP